MSTLLENFAATECIDHATARIKLLEFNFDDGSIYGNSFRIDCGDSTLICDENSGYWISCGDQGEPMCGESGEWMLAGLDLDSMDSENLELLAHAIGTMRISYPNDTGSEDDFSAALEDCGFEEGDDGAYAETAMLEKLFDLAEAAGLKLVRCTDFGGEFIGQSHQIDKAFEYLPKWAYTSVPEWYFRP